MATLVAVVLVFFLGRVFIQRWYDFEYVRDCVAGLACLLFLVGITVLLYVPKFLLRGFRNSASGAFAVVLLCALLPWGEWLKVGMNGSRGGWTWQWLHQVFFVFSCLFCADSIHGASSLLQRAGNRAVSWMQRQENWPTIVLPSVLFIAALSLSLGLRGGLPMVQDGVSYLFQAKIIASGRIWAPEPVFRPFFYTPGDMMYAGHGKWFSIFLPGYPALLAIGWLVGAPWIVTPLLAALALFFLMRLISSEFSPATSLGFGFLFLFSPLVLILSSEFMAHVPALAAVSAALYSVSRLRRRENIVLCSLLLCLALVAGALIRGFSVYTFLIPALCWYGWTQLRERRFFPMLLPLIGLGLGVGLVLWYQSATSGDPFVPGYVLKYPEYRYGFGRTFLGQVHTPLLAVENTSNHLNSMNQYLTGWASGSFLLPLAFLFLSRGLSPWEKLFCAGGLFVLLFQFFFVGIDLDLGPRMIFLTVPPLLLMTVRGIGMIWAEAGERGRRMLIVLLLASQVSVLLVSGPLFLSHLDRRNNPSLQLGHAIERRTEQRLLVFVTEDSRYSDNLIYNTPLLDGNVIVARDLGARNVELSRAYPQHRPVYFRRKSTMASTKDGLQTSSDFVLTDDRSGYAPGTISYFQLLAVIYTTVENHRYDLFDTCPYTALSYDCDTIEAFLSRDPSTSAPSPSRRKQFHAALNALIRLLTLPQCAYEKSHGDWRKSFRPREFRESLALTLDRCTETPDLCVDIVSGLEKISRRIDRNEDGVLSDAEINRYVEFKSRQFLTRSYFRD